MAWQSFKEWTRLTKKKPDEINRSCYSLVSRDLTADTLQLWMELPEEVKNDPALAPFKEKYEEEHGRSNPVAPKKAPSLHEVHSAPIISLNQKTDSENGKKYDFIEERDDRGVACLSFHCPDSQETPSMHNKEEKRADLMMETEDGQQNSWTDNSKLAVFGISKAKYYIKISVLLACWMFFTAVFLMYNEKHEEEVITSLDGGEEKNFKLEASELSSIALKISGPFLSEHAQMKLNSSAKEIVAKIEVWLEGTLDDLKGDSVKSIPWVLLLNQTSKEHLTKVLELPDSNLKHYAIRMRSTSTQTVAFVMSYALSPIDGAVGVIYACVLLCGLYVLIIFEVINRTMAAITVSTMSLAALALAGDRPTVPEVISWLDEETLLLLFSMMLLVAIMAETGIFDFLAVFTFEVTKGKLWPLIYLLCAITAILSTFLDNVTTVLLMSPVTIRLCEVMELDPVPILMFMAIYSNIGGAATPVGDPPNVIVVSNKAVAQAGINFTNFTAHMSLGIVLVFIQTSLQIKYLFRDTNKLRLAVPREIQDLTRQITIWRRATESLPHLSQDVHVVRERLERKIKKLEDKLQTLVKESSKRACPKDTFRTTLTDLKAKYKIRDKVLLIKSTIAIAFVVTVFFLHSIPELNRVSLGWTALLGAILLLTLADREDLEPILHRVEWSTLLFFAALFVLMEALSKLGLIVYVGGLMEQLILKVDDSCRLAVALMLILWVSGMISAFVDNIPLTTMMVRVVVAIGSNPSLNLPLAPLIWALLFGACLGGNGTLIGASANVVCAGVAEQHGYKFTFARFFKVGFPIMVGHLVISSVYLLICHCVFVWH